MDGNTPPKGADKKRQTRRRSLRVGKNLEYYHELNVLEETPSTARHDWLLIFVVGTLSAVVGAAIWEWLRDAVLPVLLGG